MARKVLLCKLILAYIAAFLGPFAGTMVYPILPTLQDYFHVSYFIVAFSITAYILLFAIIQFLSGILSDIYGRVKIISIGFILYSLGAFLSGVSPNMVAFIFSRVINGFGAGFIPPTVTALLGDMISTKKLGKGIGLMTTMAALGLTISPIIAGLFATTVGWTWCFFSVSIVALLLAIAFKPFNESESVKKVAIYPIISGVLSKLRENINASVLSLAIAGFFVMFFFAGLRASFPDFLSQCYSMNEYKIGIVLAASGAGVTLISPFSGWLVDKIGRIRTSLMGGGVLFFPVISLYLANSFLSFVACFAIMGSVLSLCLTGPRTISVEIFPEARGTVTSIYNGTRFIGTGLAPGLLVPVYTSLGMDILLTTGFAFVFCYIVMTYLLHLSISSPKLAK